MAEDETLFAKFWEASSLDRFNVKEFSQQLNAYDSDEKELFLEYPEAPKLLPTAKTQINKIAKKRKSDRSFSNKELSIKELGRLLSSFYAWNGLEHRAYPSAGATYVTEVFCVAFNVEGYSGKVIYYDPEKHGTVVVSDKAPTWEEASKSLNIDVKGTPNLLTVFVAFPQRAIAKYGERGGRFALLEVGASMQQLSLQIAESSKLKGVAIGGMLDSIWKQNLKLGNTDAQIVLGYLVGK
jgi:SagB-type dehydrogenase family enzyme